MPSLKFPELKHGATHSTFKIHNSKLSPPIPSNTLTIPPWHRAILLAHQNIITLGFNED
jgi:hypothetical protein